MQANIKVLVGGCFDILHIGHFRFLKKAKELGTELIVALESDATTARIKGPTRPIHNQQERKEILESLKFVDKVITLPEMLNDHDYGTLVEDIKPDIIAITEGDSFKNKKEIHAESVGAKLVEIPKISNFSSTNVAKLIGLE
jgi:D-beta-D-heptose 7-phosphate kinase/D-beta-D-heptose 1-phosphate adenosyltransferase